MFIDSLIDFIGLPNSVLTIACGVVDEFET